MSKLEVREGQTKPSQAKRTLVTNAISPQQSQGTNEVLIYPEIHSLITILCCVLIVKYSEMSYI